MSSTTTDRRQRFTAPADSDDLSQLRYGKICILADADSDGLHIATLLCALFVKHFRTLVKEGHVYVALPPLYRIDLGKEVYYALTEEEKAGLPWGEMQRSSHYQRIEAGRRGRPIAPSLLMSLNSQALLMCQTHQ